MEEANIQRATSLPADWKTIMPTMNISLPDPLRQFVDDEVRDGGFASTSDYMRDLIRQRQRRKAEETLRALIAEGLASGPATPVTPEVFDRLRQQLREQMLK